MDATGKSVLENPFTDMLIDSRVIIPQGKEIKSATAKGRAKDPDVNIIGTFNYNPILDSIVYDVGLPDGVVKQYSNNTVTENIYAQADQHGRS